jgi:hypothetical protein
MTVEKAVFAQMLNPDFRELSKAFKIFEGGFENAVF